MLSEMFPILQAQPGPSISQAEVVMEHSLAFETVKRCISDAISVTGQQ